MQFIVDTIRNPRYCRFKNNATGGHNMEFNINETDFNICQIPSGEHEDKWCWSTDTHEGKPCDTAVEAQQDALDWVKAQADKEADEREQEAIGYEASVAMDYRNAIRL